MYTFHSAPGENVMLHKDLGVNNVTGATLKFCPGFSLIVDFIPSENQLRTHYEDTLTHLAHVYFLSLR